MTPFLQQVASAYVRNELPQLTDYCFVFPNKRSGVFFRHYLSQEAGGKTFIMPEIGTIAEVTRHFSSLTEAPRLDQLFILYNEYRRLSTDVVDFDQFIFWGEMLLNDFNDVDLYLVDPHRLFVNLKRFREVSSNYLTDEQIEIINRYWGERFDHSSPDNFWNHLHHEQPTSLETKFLKLWEVLDELFSRFKQSLLDNGMATRGMLARIAVEKLSRGASTALPFKRYIFIGFNVLTLSEINIFDKLRARGCADFYWDLASPALHAEGNRGALFMKRNAECFPSLYDLSALYPESPKFPEIHITGVPSAFGQTKAAGLQLRQWIDDKVIADPSNAIDTAVVLPDETLFVPMIHAVPLDIKALNVTMGFPLKSTSTASLITSIVNLQLRATLARDQWSFFYEDIRTVVSHPLLQAIDPEGCNAILLLMVERRLYMVPSGLLADTAPKIAFIFQAVRDTNSLGDVHDYFFNLITGLQAYTAGNPERKIENYFLDTYLVELETIRSTCSRWNISMRDRTFIELLQRTISSGSVRFTGEPLAGLQVMGVLETRALDFDKLIMLSMNEHVFPRKQYSRSFIPDSLRRSYGMATTELQESIFAYSFYRLISRASQVRLFYDARTLSGKNSEISRYIAQLLYLFPECHITHDLANLPGKPTEEEEIVIRKTPDIMEKLRGFTPPGDRYLSATAINDYIKCPLSFFLKKICGLDLDEDVMDYMDAGTYGTILHEVAERLYSDLRGDASEVKVTPEILDHFYRDEVRIDKLITALINEKFNRFPKGDLTPLVGESLVIGKVMKHFLRLMFLREKEIAPFDFIAAEHKVRGTMRISDTLTVNIYQVIDRIDRIYPGGRYGEGLGVLRIVDYKTGADKTDFKTIDDLFNPSKDRRKAILQLMFYCNAYAADMNYREAIRPQIYAFKTISKTGLEPLRYNGHDFEDYREINDEFMERFRSTVSEIFNPDVPFTQAEDKDGCKYCGFKTICRRGK
ncbi:MAG: PD-(D/E)XK nuclease family protein [Staphylococcus sp.]|nr:PD-(D/E)XK nuclease family protein [Staphylococcus sp.]